MTMKVVVFGLSPTTAPDHLPVHFTGSDFVYEWVHWDQHLRIDSGLADLIVLWADDAPRRTACALEGLKLRPASKPTLVVLPLDAGPDLVRLASQAGDDFMLSTGPPAEFLQRLQRMLGPDPNSTDEVSRRLTEEFVSSGLIGRDPVFLQTLARVPLAARSPSPVLITGETGTGKELFARAIHTFSARRALPFIPVDCASLPDHLFENELFGHARGAYTDARSDQRGLVGMANQGTLFLDEIDALSIGSQAKLLRFLQERTYRPLGSDKFLQADVKLIAATNKNLQRLAEAKEFRPDLLFRLNVLRLDLPPLRQRPTDVALLAHHFVHSLCLEHGIVRKGLTPAAVRRLEAHTWPGNIRELSNMIQRAVLFCATARIAPCDLDREWSEPEGEVVPRNFREARAKAIEAFERRYVEDLLRECGGNVTWSARIAGKERRAFGRLVKRYQVKQNMETSFRSFSAGSH